MATSLVSFLPTDSNPTETLNATLSVALGASTPKEAIYGIDFDDTTVEYADFVSAMPSSYMGGGVTITIIWTAAQNTNKGIWSGAFRRIISNGTNLLTDAFTYDYNTTGDIDPATTVGKVKYSTMTFTNGADMDSVVAGDMFIFRIKRPAPSGTKITGDITIREIVISET